MTDDPNKGFSDRAALMMAARLRMTGVAAMPMPGGDPAPVANGLYIPGGLTPEEQAAIQAAIPPPMPPAPIEPATVLHPVETVSAVLSLRKDGNVKVTRVVGALNEVVGIFAMGSPIAETLSNFGIQVIDLTKDEDDG